MLKKIRLLFNRQGWSVLLKMGPFSWVPAFMPLWPSTKCTTLGRGTVFSNMDPLGDE